MHTRPQTSAELPLPSAPAPHLPRTALGSPGLLDLCTLGVLDLGSAPTSAVTGFSFNSVMWAVAWPGVWMPLYWADLTHTSCWGLSSPRFSGNDFSLEMPTSHYRRAGEPFAFPFRAQPLELGWILGLS